MPVPALDGRNQAGLLEVKTYQHAQRRNQSDDLEEAPEGKQQAADHLDNVEALCGGSIVVWSSSEVNYPVDLCSFALRYGYDDGSRTAGYCGRGRVSSERSTG